MRVPKVALMKFRQVARFNASSPVSFSPTGKVTRRMTLVFKIPTALAASSVEFVMCILQMCASPQSKACWSVQPQTHATLGSRADEINSAIAQLYAACRAGMPAASSRALCSSGGGRAAASSAAAGLKFRRQRVEPKARVAASHHEAPAQRSILQLPRVLLFTSVIPSSGRIWAIVTTAV